MSEEQAPYISGGPVVKLAPGDRVEYVIDGRKGTVEHADAKLVRVRWDDGLLWLLFTHANASPQARHLQKLKALENGGTNA